MLQILLTIEDAAFEGERWSSERSLPFNHAGFHSLRTAQRFQTHAEICPIHRITVPQLLVRQRNFLLGRIISGLIDASSLTDAIL
jgi:hypothetical protein